jgi:hypothetical protein
VRGDGEELVTRPHGRLGLVVEARVLDGEGHPVGQVLGHHQVGVVEGGPAGPAPEGDHPQRPLAGGQRRDQGRAGPHLGQQGAHLVAPAPAPGGPVDERPHHRGVAAGQHQAHGRAGIVGGGLAQAAQRLDPGGVGVGQPHLGQPLLVGAVQGAPVGVLLHRQPGHLGQRLLVVQRREQGLAGRGQEALAHLALLERGDVLDDGDEAARLAGGAAQEGDGDVHPDHPPVLVQAAGLPPVGLGAAAQDLPQRHHVAGHVPRIADVLQALLPQLLPGVAEDLAEARVHAQELPVGGGVGDAHPGLVEGGLEDRLAVAQGLLAPLPLGRPQGLLLAADAQGLAEQVDEHRHLGPDDVGVERLDQVVDRAHRVAAVDEVEIGPVGGQEQDGDVLRGLALAHEGRGLEAVHGGHHHVQQDAGELLAQQQAQGLAARLGGDDAVVGALQDPGEREQVLPVVVDHQDGDLLGLRRVAAHD